MTTLTIGDLRAVWHKMHPVTLYIMTWSTWCQIRGEFKRAEGVRITIAPFGVHKRFRYLNGVPLALDEHAPEGQIIWIDADFTQKMLERLKPSFTVERDDLFFTGRTRFFR